MNGGHKESKVVFVWWEICFTKVCFEICKLNSQVKMSYNRVTYQYVSFIWVDWLCYSALAVSINIEGKRNTKRTNNSSMYNIYPKIGSKYHFCCSLCYACSVNSSICVWIVIPYSLLACDLRPNYSGTNELTWNHLGKIIVGKGNTTKRRGRCESNRLCDIQCQILYICY